MAIELVMPSNYLVLCLPFSSWLQSFPASGSFPVSQFFASGGQSIGSSASASVLPMNIQGWFPLGWTGWISLQSKGLSRVFSNTTVQKHQFFSAQFSSVAQSCPTLQPHEWQHARPPGPSPTPGACSNSCPSSRWCHPNISSSLAPSPPAFNFSQHQGLFQRVSSSHQVAKVLEFSFSISPSNEYSGLISFRMYWLDLLAVQGTLKSLLQHHSSKAAFLRHSSFYFIAQLSHPYMTTGKIIALTRRTFVGKVMSLLFNMMSRLTPWTIQSMEFSRPEYWSG